MRIDAHQHFWRYSKTEYDWLNPAGCLARDFLPQDLEPLRKANGVDRCIAVQARQTVEETSWLLDLAAQDVAIAKVVGWEDLQAPDLMEKLKHWQSCDRLAGFRHVIQDEPDDSFMLRPTFVAGVRAALAAGFTFDILIKSRQLDALLPFLEKAGPGKLIVDHGAKPEICDRSSDKWFKIITEAGKFQNLHCKISGLITEANHRSWTIQDIEPYFVHLLESFGPDRLLAGSDWPVCLLAGSYERVWSLMSDLVYRYCPHHAEAILGENARRFYGVV